MTQAHNTANWDAHYRSRIGESYPAHVRQAYRPFLDTLRQYMRTIWQPSPRPIVVREEGCGIGTITKILAQDANPESHKFVAFDYDAAQVENTRANLRSVYADVNVYQGDHFQEQGEVDVIHAHGVLEHFSDEEIAKVLERQKKEALFVIHYVPLDGWVTGSYGDERLLPIEHWQEVHKPTKTIVFNGGRDAVLIWS